MDVLKFGIIGYGYWGPNIVRNLNSIVEAQVKAVCDLDEENLVKVNQLYPAIKTTRDYQDIVKSDDIDAVAIVTPVSTHYQLARECLEAGKHIFIEKPFTAHLHEAEELVALARQKNLIIMVDHTFLFTGAVRKIKELVDADVLGRLHYIDSTRVSLGLFQHDVNVVWDLAPHDFSIIDHLIDSKPLSLSAQGEDHLDCGHENIAYVTMYFENKLIVHINVNWMSPIKVRTMLIGGSKKMLQWNDLESDEKLRVYDKGVTRDTKEGSYQLRVDYRSGDMWSPRVEHQEALKRELQYFIDCVNSRQTPFNDGEQGVRVVRMLELTNQSLKTGGKLVKF